MTNEQSTSSNTDDIDNLTQQIAALRVQLNTLKQGLLTATQANKNVVPPPQPPVAETPRGHRVGNRVVITNNY